MHLLTSRKGNYSKIHWAFPLKDSLANCCEAQRYLMEAITHLLSSTAWSSSCKSLYVKLTLTSVPSLSSLAIVVVTSAAGHEQEFWHGNNYSVLLPLLTSRPQKLGICCYKMWQTIASSKLSPYLKPTFYFDHLLCAFFLKFLQRFAPSFALFLGRRGLHLLREEGTVGSSLFCLVCDCHFL